jgi:hypothetical protein
MERGGGGERGVGTGMGAVERGIGVPFISRSTIFSSAIHCGHCAIPFSNLKSQRYQK